MATFHLNINGSVKTVDVDASTPLLWVLREELKLTGTKYGCGISACGACTVHVAGIATRSCVVPVIPDAVQTARCALCRRYLIRNSWPQLVPGSKRAHRVRKEDEAMATFHLNINGSEKTVDVDPSTPLLWVLREELKLTGTKYGCGISACGACTVHVAGIATRSCVVPVELVGDRPIVTIEAIGKDPVGRVVQNAWIETDVVQCGYCQSGQIMSAVALLKDTKKPTDKNIEESMGGNLCRCATYVRIREAIKRASQQLG